MATHTAWPRRASSMLLVMLWGCYSFTTFSQNQLSGIYRTADDFKNENLKFTSACAEQNDYIKFRNKAIVIKTKDERFKIRKSDVFAVSTCHGTFRIYNNEEFKIVNRDSIFLYNHTVGFGEDSHVYQSFFFFSVEPDSEIFPLTKLYLRKAFSDNKKFLELIDLALEKKSVLSAYNKQINKYELISLYEKSTE